MNYEEIMQFLANHGSEQTRKIYRRHGAHDPINGVKIGDLKKVVKRIGKDQKIANQLWKSGNSDAMYLAGLIGDEKQITEQELREWVKSAYWYMLSEGSVASLAAESPYGWKLGLEWIDVDDEQIEAAGWGTLSSWVSFRADAEIDYEMVKQLLKRIEISIHQQKNRVRYGMNNFVIVIGSYIVELHKLAREVAENIGVVQVNVGQTSCKVPLATEYIDKIERMGRIGKKRKHSRC